MASFGGFHLDQQVGDDGELLLPPARADRSQQVAGSLGQRRVSVASPGVEEILRRTPVQAGSRVPRTRTVSFAAANNDVQNGADTIQVHPDQQLANRRASVASVSQQPEGDDELTGCAGSFFCHPKRVGHSILGVVLMCGLGFGSYFCFDNPGALQNEIKEDMDVTTFQFSTLYSWYSLPNILLPLIGGFLMDGVFGLRAGTCIFAAFIVLGQALTAFGAYTGRFSLMQFGRFVFGVGGESLAVAQNTYTVTWFKGKELNMIFGLQLSFARFGSTVNFMLVGPLYAHFAAEYPDKIALGWTLYVAGATTVMSLACALALAAMDKRVEVLVRKKEKKGSSADDEKVNLKDIIHFPPSFWLLCIVCWAYYVAIFPFISLGQVYFIKKFAFTAKEASFITGLIYLISAFASPILGFMIDKTGRNITCVFISCLGTLVGHSMLALTFWNPYVAIVIMGLSYSLLASALWPIAALMVPDQLLGSAYGKGKSILVNVQ